MQGTLIFYGSLGELEPAMAQSARRAALSAVLVSVPSVESPVAVCARGPAVIFVLTGDQWREWRRTRRVVGRHHRALQPVRRCLIMNMYLAIVALTTVTASFISVALGADPATLARQLVQPWQAANVDCSCRPLTGGLSNVLWLCSADTPKVHPQHVVVRQYHLSGALLDRDREQRVAKYLADQGIAPRIYGMQGDTRVEQYINGTSLGKVRSAVSLALVPRRTCLLQDFGTKPTLMVTAELLANFHKVVPGNPHSQRRRSVVSFPPRRTRRPSGRWRW